jgi:phospholipase/carboxylesterase
MRTQLGSLDVVAVQLQSHLPPKGLVVLCHGFGAPGDDLLGLAESLVAQNPTLADVRFLFPQGPLSLGQWGFGDARAWWMIDFEKLDALKRAGGDALAQFRRIEPEGMAAARRQLTVSIAEAMNGTKLPYSKLILGGFSQGAMITTDVALRLEDAPAALVTLSGTLLLEEVWRARAKARSGLKVFQSHGRLDEVLPFEGATALHSLLTESGLDVEFRAFEGGHEIPRSVVSDLATFLGARLGL